MIKLIKTNLHQLKESNIDGLTPDTSDSKEYVLVKCSVVSEHRAVLINTKH